MNGIGDFYGQYNNRGIQTQTNPTQQSAVASLSNTLKQLTQGLIFEGNVTRVKGDNVLLSLENGQSIHARLDANLKLVQGQSMFFQVKSNDGNSIAIRPYGGDGLMNPTLRMALKAAGLPIDDRNLEMVNSMMKEQMPIDADSLLSMHKSLAMSQGVSVDTVVQMTRLGMEITPDQAQMFENYKSDTELITAQLSDFSDEAVNLLASDGMGVEEALTLQTELLSIIESGMPDEELIMPDSIDESLFENEMADDAIDNDIIDDASGGKNQNIIENNSNQMLSTQAFGNDNKAVSAGLFGSAPDRELNATRTVDRSVYLDFEEDDFSIRPGSIESFMSSDEMDELGNVLRTIGNMADREEIFDEDGDLNRNLTAKQLLNYINNEMVLSKDELDPTDVRDVLGSKGYKKLINNLVEKAFTIEPHELGEEDKMKQLYSRLNAKLEALENTLKQTGHDNSQLSNTANDIKTNIEFMQQVNQIYQYVQIPFNNNGQNASADLYVYTNKKAKNGPDDELSAFLHLDMDHLGSTDCMVKLKGKAVSTNFTFSDDRSYDLVQQYLPLLQQKLDALGFNSTVTAGTAEADSKPFNFVEDFLKKDLPTNTGVVHRYSFDVRA